MRTDINISFTKMVGTFKSTCSDDEKDVVKYTEYIIKSATPNFPNAASHFKKRIKDLPGDDAFKLARCLDVMKDVSELLLAADQINYTMNHLLDTTEIKVPGINIASRLADLASLDAIPQKFRAVFTRTKTNAQERQSVFDKLFDRFYTASCTVEMKELLVDITEFAKDAQAQQPQQAQQGGAIDNVMALGFVSKIVSSYTGVMADVKIMNDPNMELARKGRAVARVSLQLIFAFTGVLQLFRFYNGTPYTYTS